ncbi:hypothetical protein [Prescottella agglutinans]|uniref:Phage-related protein n=1 Tax=Prescottella agglutinans TaxID=1644129 RepID=A0ABT6M5F8_9NOCA|nr:hypothetical protein [Prescottella agglutinans]MDH6279542.1 phage-related protein [Prescottella agglutinans]
MTAPFATASVKASLDWGNLDAEFEARVRAAAVKATEAAEKHFKDIEFAANVRLDADTGLFSTETQMRLDALSLSADVTLDADTGLFSTEMQSRLDLIQLDARVELDADTGLFRTLTQARLDALSLKADVELKADTSLFSSVTQATLTLLPPDAQVTLDADTVLFQSVTQARLNLIDLDANVTLDADTGLFSSATQARLDTLSLSADVTLKADKTQLLASLAGLSADVPVKLDVSAAHLQSFVDTLNAKLAAADIVAPVKLKVANEAQFNAHIAQLTQTETKNIIINTIGGVGGAGGGGGGVAGLDLSLGRVARTGLKIAGIASLIGAIGGAAGLAAGAVGALAVGLAGVGAAGMAGLGTTVLGLQGIGKAFSALNEAADSSDKEAEAQAKAVASATKQVEQAERGVRDAKKDARRAEEDLTRARKDAKDQIDELNFSLKGAALDEKDAAIALREAQAELRKTKADPNADKTDRDRARLNVEKALLRQEEVGRKNKKLAEEAAEANAKGVEGSDQVVAAKERIEAANERVTDSEKALTDATTALQEALTSSSSAADKAAEAMEKLSPNARAFVLAMMDLKPQFQELKNVVQDAMFADLDGVFTDLVTTSMPMLKEGLGGVATSINGAAKEFAGFWASAEAQDGLRNLFAGTANMITAMQPGLEQLSLGLVNIGNAAAPVMDQIGASLGGLLGQVGQAFTDAFNSGALTQLFSTFSTILDGLGDGLNALLGGLIEFGNIVGPVVGPLLKTLGEAIADLAPALGELGVAFGDALIEILPTLSQFISMLADGLTPIMPIISELLGMLAVALAPLIQPLSDILQIVGIALVDAISALAPAIEPFGEAFASLVDALAPILPLIAQVIEMIVSALAPALNTIFDAFAPVIEQIVDGLRPVLEALAPVLAQVAGILADVFASALEQLAPIFAELVPVLTTIAQVLAQSLGQALTALAPVFIELVTVAGQFLQAALLPLLPVLQQLAEKLFPILADVIVQLAPILSQLATSVGAVLVQMAPIIGEIAGLLADVLMQAIEALAPLIPPLAEAFLQVIEAVLPLLPVILDLVMKLLPPLMNIFIALLPVIDPIVGIITTLVQIFAKLAEYWVPIIINAIENLGSIFSGIFDGIGKVVGWVVDTIIVPMLERWQENIGKARDFISGALDGIKGFFHGLGEKVGEVKDWIVDKWNGLVEFVTGLPGRIRDAASGMWDGVKDAFKGAINWIIEKWNNFQLTIGGFEVFGKKMPSITIDTPDIPYLARGGLAGQRSDGVLFGPGTGISDDILGLDESGIPTARVAHGEMVINKEQTDRNLPLLSAINAGWTPSPEFLRGLVYGLPGHAGGGVVGGGGASSPSTVTAPPTAGTSAGKQLNRGEWIALFGNAEEFDRILAEQNEKNRQQLTDTEQRYVGFGETVTGVLGGLKDAVFPAHMEGLAEVAKTTLGTTDEGQKNWDNLGAKVGQVATGMLEGTFPALRQGLDGLGQFAKGIVDGFGTDWARMPGLVAPPVNWIIDKIVNTGLRDAWMGVKSAIPSLPDWGAPVAQITGYATGGIMSGYTPGRDDRIIAVGGGEAVMRPEWTRAMGPDYVNSMNAAARSGGVSAVQKLSGAYASGGIVQGGAELTTDIQRSMWDAVRTAFPNAQLSSGTRYEDVGSGYDNHMAARAIDLGGPVGNLPEQARWIARTYPDSLELIHWPLDGWENLKNGAPLNYGDGTNSQHMDHVHWAMSEMVTSDGKFISAGGGGGGLAGARSAVLAGFEAAMGKIGQEIPDFGPSLFGQLPGQMFDAMKSAASAEVGKLAGRSGSSGGNSAWDVSAGAEQWRQMMIDAYKNQGYDPTPEKIDAWVRQIDTESHGDPNIAQQIVDVNGTGEAAGVGLGQMIPTTWQAYRDPSLSDNRRDPWAMTNAMVRYGEQKYGADLLDVIGQGHGYDQGGVANGIGLLPKWTIKPERVLSPEMTPIFERLVDVLERPEIASILRALDPGNALTPIAAPELALKAVEPAPVDDPLKKAAQDAGQAQDAYDYREGYDPKNLRSQLGEFGLVRDKWMAGEADLAAGDAWLADQEFAPRVEEWAINAGKEMTGQFTDQVGLTGLVNQDIDTWVRDQRLAAIDANDAAAARGEQPKFAETVNFYGMDPGKVGDEVIRAMAHGMAPVTQTYRKG